LSLFVGVVVGPTLASTASRMSLFVVFAVTYRRRFLTCVSLESWWLRLV
jgi:hypothetical protein